MLKLKDEDRDLLVRVLEAHNERLRSEIDEQEIILVRHPNEVASTEALKSEIESMKAKLKETEALFERFCKDQDEREFREGRG